MQTIQILPEVYAKIMTLVRECPWEINGLAKIEHIQRRPIITDVVVLKQTVTAASADHDKEALMKFFEERFEQGDGHQWKVQWHSHVNMGVFHSSIDDAAIEAIGETADWLVSLVFNKSGEMKGRVDIFQPFKIADDKVELSIVHEIDDYSEWAKEQIAEHVTREVTTTPLVKVPPISSAHGGFDRHGQWHDDQDFTEDGTPKKKRKRKGSQNDEPESWRLNETEEEGIVIGRRPAWMGKRLSDMTEEEVEEYAYYMGENYGLTKSDLLQMKREELDLIRVEEY